MRTTLGVLAFLIIVIVAASGVYYWHFTAAGSPSIQKAQLANPASVHCVNDLGGSLEIRSLPTGQVGYCHLPNGEVCEEWALMHGECATNPSATPAGYWPTRIVSSSRSFICISI